MGFQRLSHTMSGVFLIAALVGLCSAEDALRGYKGFAASLLEKATSAELVGVVKTKQDAPNAASSQTAAVAWCAVILGAPISLALMMRAKRRSSENEMVGCCGCAAIVFGLWVYTMLVFFGFFDMVSTDITNATGIN